MNDIVFTKTQGGVIRSLPGEDHISGFVAYVADADLPAGYSTTDRVKSYSSVASAESDGIVSTSEKWMVKVIHYHISEFFRIAPQGILYVGLFTPAVSTYTYAELTTLQNFADGKIRQAVVYNPSNDIAAGEITALQAIATALEAQKKPVVIIAGLNLASAATLAAAESLAALGQENVSIVIGQDGEGVAKTLFEHDDVVGSVTCAGLILGMISKSSVHESISWVQKFPSGINNPALSDGTLVKEVDNSVLEALNTSRFIFLRKHVGIAGSYANDSHNMSLVTGDYAYIESVRTIDKAIRGIRIYLLPYLSSPLYVDPDTGKLRPGTVAFIETLAGKQLENMEAAGELSGYLAEVDPAQNVLSTSEVEIVIKQLGVGVMRKVAIKIGFTTNLS
jgi:hypothetical protein